MVSERNWNEVMEIEIALVVTPIEWKFNSLNFQKCCSAFSFSPIPGKLNPCFSYLRFRDSIPNISFQFNQRFSILIFQRGDSRETTHRSPCWSLHMQLVLGSRHFSTRFLQSNSNNLFNLLYFYLLLFYRHCNGLIVIFCVYSNNLWLLLLLIIFFKFFVKGSLFWLVLKLKCRL